ncbi:MAG: archaemetzincin [Lentisphaeraceae bacterium]|nr:archaemetzincin [Lentisphaeraceae bacterium]
MKAFYSFLTVALTILFLPSCSDTQKPQEAAFSKEKTLKISDSLRKEKLSTETEALRPNFKPFGPILKGDWITTHGSDKGQSFEEYKKSNPNRPNLTKNKIYILQIGTFTESQEKILTDTMKYMEACFGVSVKKLSTFPLNKIPLTARRRHREWLHEQLNAKYIINDILYPNRPDDALALIAFTSKDLYPGEGWNFVFGLASLTKRIGVWSIFRNGDPSDSQAHYMTCLRRTISTAIHETGHILGIKHCLAYECVMCGSNSREESDRRGLSYCPQCMEKLTWNTDIPVRKHLEKLFKVSRQLGLIAESKFFANCLAKTADKSSEK